MILQIRVSLLVFVGLLLCLSGAQAEETEGRAGTPVVREIKFSALPFFTAGKITGKASEYLEYLSDSFIDKVFLGGGMSLYYHPHRCFAVGFTLEYLVKDIPETNLDRARGIQYSASFIGFLSSRHRSRFYGRIDMGVLSAKVNHYPEEDEDMDLGSHNVFRLGFGFFDITSSLFITRVELYYKRAFSEGHRIEDYFFYRIDFDAECIGLEAGIGVAL